MRRVIVAFLVTFVLSSVICHGLDVAVLAGMPFYADGTGVVGEVSINENMNKLIGAPIYVKFGLGFQYAQGSENNYVVNLVDFGAIVGGAYYFTFDKVIMFGGLDLSLSYGNSFNDFASSGSVGVSFRPNAGVGYSLTDKLRIFVRAGYNSGLYQSYIGYVFFNLGLSLGL
ncbi:MAG: hypothetical protein ABDH28_05480 [Brevinematia bacterium]